MEFPMLNMSKLPNSLGTRVKITYINEGGYKCQAIVEDPLKIHHIWYSSKRNLFGKFDRHEVTIFAAYLNKLKNCKNVEVVVGDDVTS